MATFYLIELLFLPNFLPRKTECRHLSVFGSFMKAFPGRS